jgi:amino acid transporter
MAEAPHPIDNQPTERELIDVASTPPPNPAAPSSPPTRVPLTEHKTGGLGEFAATAICGNDITSSCLYVSSLAILQAGKLAPLALLLVAGVLFLFRRIYAEVVGALPLNGGAYNALLNTTSKQLASLAACLTLLSYMATAVISGLEAMHYLHHLWHGLSTIPATVLLLAFFMLLTIVGIGESAMVAIGIFALHLSSLSLLLLLGVGHLFLGSGSLETLWSNIQAPLPDGRGLLTALFFGFAISMLGISGFESSSNFVEEQAEGVFPKTLRNMWVAVSFFNPMMALLALSLIPLEGVVTYKETLLSHMGAVAGGSWLSGLISINAVFVLSGAVLTSFIGVTGLVRRMTLDRCLPQFLLKTNRRGTSHRIVIGFFILSVSVLLITRGQVEALAGVYTISFLSVMVLFGLGNILLKVRRARLPRPTHAGWMAVLTAVSAVILGVLGNIIMHPDYFRIFLWYFIPAALVVTVMLGRVSLLKGGLFFTRNIAESIGRVMARLTQGFEAKIEEINSQQFVFFTRGDDIATLNKVMLYVRDNEQTKRIKVVTVINDDRDVTPGLQRDLDFLDKAYPEIDIEFVTVHGTFGPQLVKELEQQWNIPANFMFIGSPGDHFLYGLAELGGVRLII